MFKIVQTTENNRIKLTVVPSAWQKNGELSWPKFKTDKLIKDPNSVPDDTWFKMKCKLKRNYLLNENMANEELDRMLDKDETDPEEKLESGTNNLIPKKRARVIFPKSHKTSNENDFNSLAESCLISDESPNLVEPPQVSRPVINTISHNVLATDNNSSYLDKSPQKNVLMEDIEEIIVPEKEYLVLKDVTDSDLPTENAFALQANEPTHSIVFGTETNATLNEKLDAILANQAVITNNQIIIINKIDELATKENQVKIIKELAKIETMIEVIGTRATCEPNQTGQYDKGDNIKPTTSNSDIETIKNLKSLSELEQKLEDKNVIEEYVKKLGYICGKSGSGNGLNNANILADRLFDRKFMIVCSWAGGSRDKKEKIPLKVYKHVIQLFANVVRLSNKNFTLTITEEFLKNILRNSTRRSETNLSRCSSIKRRPKKLTYQENAKAVDVRVEVQV